MKVIDEEMIKIMDNISSIQQKRVHAEREQLRKKHQLSVEPVLVENKSIFFMINVCVYDVQYSQVIFCDNQLFDFVYY